MELHLEEKSQGRIYTPPPQNSLLQSLHHHLIPPQHGLQLLPPKPSTIPTDPWRIQYCIERERLSPRDSKPSSLLFFTETPEKANKRIKT